LEESGVGLEDMYFCWLINKHNIFDYFILKAKINILNAASGQAKVLNQRGYCETSQFRLIIE
jgi:hypothetical protein